MNLYVKFVTKYLDETKIESFLKIRTQKKELLWKK